MLINPERASLVSGSSEGKSELEAIDNAMLEAGIGNLNIVEVSSVIPSKCKIVDLPETEPGTITPAAVAKKSTEKNGSKISASVAVALSKDSHGMISEFRGVGLKENEAEKKSISIVKNMMRERNLSINKIRTATASHRVKNIGAVIAAVVLLH